MTEFYERIADYTPEVPTPEKEQRQAIMRKIQRMTNLAPLVGAMDLLAILAHPDMIADTRAYLDAMDQDTTGTTDTTQSPCRLTYVLAPVGRPATHAVGPFATKQQAREYRDARYPGTAPVALVPPDDVPQDIGSEPPH